jgi:PKD repeat protein
MIIKKTIIILISLLFICSATINAVNFNKKEYVTYTSNEEKQANLPTWYEENFWQYDMDFVFTVRKIPSGIRLMKVDADITDMVTTVEDIVTRGDEEAYKLDVDGEISGKIEVPVIGDFASIRGDFGGNAYVSVDTLAMKEFVFNVDGEVFVFGSWHTLIFDMSMTFSPRFDFFDFPIVENEDTWQVIIDDATLNANVYIDILGGWSESYSESTEFVDNMNYMDYEQKNGYDCFLIGGDWGNPSNLWYAPDAGFLAKIEESIFFVNEEDGYEIQSDFNLDLEDTSYDADNHPPGKPEKPTGPVDGVTGESYSYSTVTSDREGDELYYMFDWGDNSDMEWVGPFESGEEITVDHIWENKGSFSVRVRAKDDSGASEWSDSLAVMIAGDPHFNCTVSFVKEKDYIDVGSEPEWYYQFILYDGNYNIISTDNVFNKNSNGDWISNITWEPDFSHVYNVDSRYVNFALKLYDHDTLSEGGWDDMADISGCKTPDDQGADNVANNVADALDFYKRGAVFHGTYDLVNSEMISFSETASDKRDKWGRIDAVTYSTSGDYIPDSSTGDEGMIPDAENDAKMFFRVEDDYELPVCSASVSSSEENFRPTVEIDFSGSVSEGVPGYSWSWDFDDGTSSDVQNPTHIFDSGGIYNVILSVTDGFGQTISSDIVVNIPYNNVPVLTGPSMDWDRKKDEVSFSVHYRDSDGDDPVVKKLFVDGTSYSLKGSGSNSDYSLILSEDQIGRGTHTYYFHFEDGFGGVSETEPKSFKGVNFFDLFDFSFLEKIINFIIKLINS